MKKIIYNKFDKNKLATLPPVTFPGRIITILSAGEAERAVDYLLTFPILGIDTETRPSFKKGRTYQVALLQVSTYDTCFLFRLNVIGVTPAVIRLLENKTVPMVGLSLHNDLLSLHQRAAFEPGAFVDLQDEVVRLGIEDMSLQKIYANLFHQKISKRQRLSNWEADVLNDRQRMYAATDAWTCLKLYDEICRLADTDDYELVTVPEPEPKDNQPIIKETK